MRRAATTIACLGSLLASPTARAAIAPASGGLDTLEVEPEGGALRVRHCLNADCSDHDPGNAGRLLPIPIPGPRQDLAHAAVDVLPIGEGRAVVHVRIPDRERPDVAFEALLAGQREDVLFAGLTGLAGGQEGERSGEAVLVYDRDDGTKSVLVGALREDTRICGQATTPVTARGLDPRTLTLRGATFHRLPKEIRDAATAVTATATTASVAPLAQLLVATGGSAPNAGALTDGATSTAWSELRPGDGHGEFATLRAPAELPLEGLRVTPTPPAPGAKLAAPRTLLVTTDTKVFRIAFPEDGRARPGQAYEVAFPEPVRTSCVSVVLEDAFAHGPAPEVAIAEVAALSRFDRRGASLADVVEELGGAGADEAQAVLARAGEPGLAALLTAYPRLEARARARAIDIAASAGACDAGPGPRLVVHGLADEDAEVRRRAVGRIARCGKAAAGPLVEAVRAGDERAAPAATALATVAPSLAVDPVGDALGHGSPKARHALRAAFARTLAIAPRAKLLALLDDREAPPAVRLDRVRAIGPRLAELRPTPDALLADLLAGSPAMETRWLLVGPLADLARAPDATPGELGRLAALAKHDPEAHVRAHAVERAGSIPALHAAVVAAASDPEPRVREAALRAIAAGEIGAGAAAARQALGHDRWTFVRIAAVQAIVALRGAERLGAASAADDDALAHALDDASPQVRAAAVAALAHTPAKAEAIYAHLDDAREDTDVRIAAAGALAALCWRDATDRLTKLALHAADPDSERQDRLAQAALAALGALHPRDLAKRLAPLHGKGVGTPVQRTVERLLREPGTCR